MATKKPRSTEGLSTLDDFLDEEAPATLSKLSRSRKSSPIRSSKR